MEKKLYRNEHNKMVVGVASGVATYVEVDVTIIRLLFVLSTIFVAGAGIIAYIVLWMMTPVNNDPALKFKEFNDLYNNGNAGFEAPQPFNTPYQDATQTKWNTPNANADIATPTPKLKNNDTGKTIIGLILLVLGVYFLLRQLDFIPYWFNIFHVYKLWPLAIVALGISLIFKKKRETEWESFKKTTEEAHKTSTTTATDVETKPVVVEDNDLHTEQP